jgi:hypothetical protein
MMETSEMTPFRQKSRMHHVYLLLSTRLEMKFFTKNFQNYFQQMAHRRRLFATSATKSGLLRLKKQEAQNEIVSASGVIWY